MRNKSMVITCFLIAVVVCSFLVFGRQEKLEILPHPWDFDGPTCPDPSVIIDCDIPDMPSEMMVYLPNYPKVTEASVLKLARETFKIPKIEKDSISSSRLSYTIVTDEIYFSVWRHSGGFTWEKKAKRSLSQLSDTRRSPKKEPEKIDLPDDAVCKELAIAYFQDRGLLPKDSVINEKVYSNTRVTETPLKKEVKKLSKAVMFRKKINGFLTIGNGAMINVGIGHEGEIIRVRKNWLKLRTYKRYPIKTPQEAFDELAGGKGSLGGAGKVKSITIRYYCSPQEQKFVQPVYLFDCVDSEGKSFIGEVPAIKNEYLLPHGQSLEEAAKSHSN